MKKRFLSAALALAMVLALLPVTVFAAPPAAVDGSDAAYDGDSATYYATENNTVKGDDWDGPGWYLRHVDKTQTPNVTTYHKIVKGFLAGSTYHTSAVNAATGKLWSTSLTAIGSVNVDALDNTSLTIDIYNGPTSTNTGTLINTEVTVTSTGNKLERLTVSDSKYATEVNNNIRTAADKDNRGSVTLPSAWAANKGITVKLDDVKATNGVTLQALSTATTPVPLSNSVTLTNAEIGDVTLGGTGTSANANVTYTYARQTITANRRDTLVKNAPGNKIGNITVVGNSSQVTLWDTDLDNSTVSITGTSTSLTIEGNTTGTGDITMIASVDSKVKSGAGTVNVNGTSRTGIGAIQGHASEQSTGNFTVNVKGGSVVDSISIPNANVTVSNATVNAANPAITLKNGFLKLQGNTTVDNVTFQEDGIVSEFSVTNANNKVGTVSVTNKNTFTKVNIAADNTNTFTALGLGNYTGHGVKGGTFASAIAVANEKDYLDGTIGYRVAVPTGVQYFASSKEGLSQAIAACTNAKPNAGANIVRVGQTVSKTVTLKNEGTVLAVIGFSQPSAIIMPAVVNGVTYDNWTVTDDATTSGASYKPGQEFSAAKVQDYVLDAQVAAGSVTKITSADNKSTGENGNVTVKLNGNTINLSGAAVSSGDYAVFTVRLNTDLTNKNGAIQPEININWNNKTGKATFDRNSNPGYGITFPDENTLKLDNGTTYTVSASGLKEMEGAGVFTTVPQDELEVTVTDPDYKTQSQKNGLIKIIVGDNPGTTSSFSYANSPAMNQAVNAAKATITESQVKSWRTQAQRAAWQAKSSISPTAADLATTGYNDVVLIPYLAVTVTNDNPLTMNLVPSYRVVVQNPGSGGYEDVFKGKNVGDKDGNYIVKQGTSLGALVNDLTDGKGGGGVTLTLDAAVTATRAHQDSTYVYDKATNTFTFLHAGKTGLGTVVFNSTDATVELKRLENAKHPDGTEVAADVIYKYDSLQAAVDDTLPQAAGLEDEITVKSGFSGNGAISVSGLQRIFKITTNGNTTISASASADVRVTDPTSGSTYTIQLLKDYVTAANIIVTTVENGVAIVNTVNAKPGQEVEVTVTPKEGYRTKEVTAKTNAGVKVPVTNKGNNVFAFNVPTGATRVDVTPVFLPIGALPFTDVPTDAAFYTAVQYCYEHNLINGTTLDKFAPYSTITRAQIVTILWRQAGAPTYARQGLYKDMPSNNDYYNAIIWATKNGIAQGYEDGKFYPARAINRQELATFLYRYQVTYLKRAAAGSVANLNGYTDGYRTGSWAQPAMRWAVGNGIVTGVGNSLSPTSDAPRYQAATAMYQYCNGVLGIK